VLLPPPLTLISWLALASGWLSPLPLQATPAHHDATDDPSSNSHRWKFPLRVSDNRRYLVQNDGEPFFYLGDTAWELFHRLSLDEADRYLRDRASKGFTVIQAVVLAELKGLTDPNPNGDLPLFDNDPTRPNEAYFRHVDAIVARAEELGLVIGMLPTWGDKWTDRAGGAGPVIFTPENARVYGEFLGQRYRDRPIIWILGGDRVIDTDTHLAVIEAMALGLRTGDGGHHLISFHPRGGRTSADPLHDKPWLDFNMLQSGHARDRANYAQIAADYARRPTKPCMDAEPIYENHPLDFNPKNGYSDDTDVRKAAYWAMLAGALGHTYGCHDIWQMVAPGRPPISNARSTWFDALNLPGAGQMRHVRKLFETIQPFHRLVPDQGLVADEPDRREGPHHVQAARRADNRAAVLYLPEGRPIRVNLEPLVGPTLAVQWFNPRDGSLQTAAPVSRTQDADGSTLQRFAPPDDQQGRGHDWILLLQTADSTNGT